jgi:hypothetical protein
VGHSLGTQSTMANHGSAILIQTREPCNPTGCNKLHPRNRTSTSISEISPGAYRILSAACFIAIEFLYAWSWVGPGIAAACSLNLAASTILALLAVRFARL